MKTEDCLKNFHFYQEVFMSCYEATLDLTHSDKLMGISLVFYFDPSLTMAKYNDNLGVYVRVTHQGQFVPLLNGSCLTISLKTSKNQLFYERTFFIDSTISKIYVKTHRRLMNYKQTAVRIRLSWKMKSSNITI